jgi:Transposase
MGRRGYPPEFRQRVLDLVAAGRGVEDVARDLGISDQTIYSWRHQDRIDHGLEDHLTREGKVYCAVVLDAWSRRVIGWSIDGRPTTALVTNALGMAIDQRRPNRSTMLLRTLRSLIPPPTHVTSKVHHRSGWCGRVNLRSRSTQVPSLRSGLT